MAIPHAKSAEVVDIRPLGDGLKDASTSTLLKTDSIEVIRLVMPAGKEIKPHSVPGEITVQCLEGKVDFFVGAAKSELTPGNLLYVSGGDQHSLNALEDSSVLVTIQLKPKAT